MISTSSTLNDVWPFSGVADAPSAGLLMQAWQRMTTQACRCCTELVETPAERWHTQQIAAGEIDGFHWSDAVTVILHDALCALRHACLLSGCGSAAEEPTGTVRGRVTRHSAAVVAALHKVCSGMLCDDCFAPLVPTSSVAPALFVSSGADQLVAAISPPASVETSKQHKHSQDDPVWCGASREAFFGQCAPPSPGAVRAALEHTSAEPEALHQLQGSFEVTTAPPPCAVSAPPQCALHAHGQDLWSLADFKGGVSRASGFAPCAMQLVDALGGEGGLPKEAHLHALVRVLDEIVPLAPSARRALSWILRRAGVPSKPPPPHCERPDRLRAAVLGASWGAQASGHSLHVVKPRLSTAAELQLVHSSELVQSLSKQWEQLSQSEGGGEASVGGAGEQQQSAAPPATAGNGDSIVACPAVCSSDGGDMFFTVHSVPAALLACGSTLEVTAAVLQGSARNGMALVRSPGHHATPGQCMGFCLFNSVAVAARMAVRYWGAPRVAILDWDVHHGNGTQDIFEDDPSVLYMSLHRYDAPPLQVEGGFYPFTGSAAYVGRGAGTGTTVNVPWPGAGVGDAQYEDAFRRLLLPVLREFAPEVIFVSAGFDAALFDPLGGMSVSPGGYAWMTHALHQICPGRVVVVLEGGYNLRSIALSVSAVTQVLTRNAAATVAAPMHGDTAKAEEVIAQVVTAASEEVPSASVAASSSAGDAVPSLAECQATHTSHFALHGSGGQGDVWAPHGSVSHAECTAAVDACIGVQREHWSAL